MTTVPGIDLDRLTGYLDSAAPRLLDGPLTARLLAGGKSNLTYAVTSGVHTFVLRRPPLGHVLETAHDMAREHRVITALRSSSVPVPRTLLLCEDPDVVGAPFYLMDYVAGTAYRSAESLRRLGAARTQAISRRVVETLAQLHAVDPGAVGLADFGRPDGFLARQVRRWRTQLESSRSRELVGAEELGDALAASVPPQGPPAVVHGDYRVDNVLLDDDDRVVAVLDWEMATLGDPLTDVALMVLYGELPHIDGRIVDSAAAPGFMVGEQLLEEYRRCSGRALDHMGFYVGLAAYKLAVIVEGIHLRHQRGETTGEGFEGIGEAVEPLLAFGQRAMKEY
ncbi:MAG TPA: phosphotransferase family protein [Intrasporangium sp.]|uniref:phosphotransferase family protein n=1 Tax=Intrasporangium sp. TaxID=1925024 RepID=UPI002D77E39C|nr:phosphotransferase family protein [Intrasporangium sp.]HET7399902.1 phosphotransferase family protein [Intrasporangium sp.]